MKILSNSRGVSLVILVIAMTLIAVLGASFVSLVAMKQRGFLYQNDSYRALNMANAGVEYAIRNVSDNLKDASTTYFQTPGTFQTSTSPVSVSMSSNESFSYWYDYASDILNVTGIYANSTRHVNLSNFRRYIDSITLRYDSASLLVRKPYYNSGSIIIPIFNNNNLSVHVSSVDVFMPVNGRYLQAMYFSEASEVPVYNYAADSNFDPCGSGVPLPCKDTVDWWGLSKVGIRIPSSTTAFVFNSNTPHSIPGNTASSFRILFDLPDTFQGTYAVSFRYTIGTETTVRTTSIKFVIQY